MAWLAAGRRYFLLLLSLLPVIAISPYLNFFHFGQNLPGQMIFFDHYMLMPTFLASSLVGAVAVSSPDGWRKPLMAAVIALMLLFTVYDIYLGRFWKTTETVAKRAIAISPAMPKGYFFLGMKYLEEGRYGDAKVVLSRLMSTKQWFPTFVEAYQLLGDANAFSGEYITGAGYYSQYLAYKPGDRKTLQNLSTALIEGGRHGDAMKAVETLLSLYPGDQIGLSNKKRLNELTFSQQVNR
jgi:tetratricopeptide (TPR) repeat protein